MSGTEEYKLTEEELKWTPQQQFEEVLRAYESLVNCSIRRQLALAKAAAEGGYAPAQEHYALRVSFDEETPVAERVKIALEKNIQSADQGFAPAQLRLAGYYATGYILGLPDDKWENNETNQGHSKRYLALAKAQGFVSYVDQKARYYRNDEYFPFPYCGQGWPFLQDLSPQERKQCLAILKDQLREAAERLKEDPGQFAGERDQVRLVLCLNTEIKKWFVERKDWSVPAKRAWLTSDQSTAATDTYRSNSLKQALTPWRWLWRSLGLAVVVGVPIIAIALSDALPVLTALIGEQFAVFLMVGVFGLLAAAMLMAALELLLLKNLDINTRGWMQVLVVLSAMGFGTGLALLIATLAFGWSGSGALVIAALVGALSGLLSVLILSECVKLAKGYSIQTAEIFPSLFTDEHRRSTLSSMSLKHEEGVKHRVLPGRAGEEGMPLEGRPRAGSDPSPESPA